MRLSIIIPVYNAEPYLDKLMHTILQSTQEFEVICVDDGSKDNSLSKLRSITDSRIKVYTKKNEGVYKAWTYGLERASNEYVTVFDSDDYIDTEYLNHISDFIDKIHADMLCIPYHVENENGGGYDSILPFEDGLYTGEKLEQIRKVLLSGSISYSKDTKVVKRELLCSQVSNGIKAAISDFEDWATVLPIFGKINSLYVINRAFYHYVQHPVSVTKSTVSYRKNYVSLNHVLDYFETVPDITDENIDSISFFGKRSILYRCMKINELDLAKEIMANANFKRYAEKANIGKFEKVMFHFGSVHLLHGCYVIKKSVQRIKEK